MAHVWLIGMMGSGKSTVGRLVAENLDRPFYDTDAAVEAAVEMPIMEIFERFDFGSTTARKRRDYYHVVIQSKPTRRGGPEFRVSTGDLSVSTIPAR